MTAYPNLLAPIRVAGDSLPNRIVMGAMHTRLETLDRPYERLAAFYAARARGEAALILTGGHAPVPEGVMEEGSPVLDRRDQLPGHERVTSEVRKAGGRIVLQILHAGRYAKIEGCVAPSATKARINRHAPRALSTGEVWATVDRYADTAVLAREAGYAGVEIMGSEGYLINEFTAPVTNLRDDEFGGSFERRIRFPLEILRAARSRVGPDFMVIYRISSVDLVDGGMTAPEIAAFARQVELAGADVINTGIGWHESAVPTIAAAVPRAAWEAAARNVKEAVTIPVIASNRINTPDVAEHLIASGAADLVSMARPLLADPDFAKKTRTGRADEIDTCIACNQACLDRIFTERTATCLVNPRAGREIDFVAGSAVVPRRIAVVGGGPAGMAFALEGARRGHRISLFESAAELGGQLNLAKRVPGKYEFHETLRYFRVSLDRAGVEISLNTWATVDMLSGGRFDEIVVATGVTPRIPAIPGISHAKVVSYADVLSGRATIGERVAIVGAGGIGFDVAEFLTGDPRESTDAERFLSAWGADPTGAAAGGLSIPAAARPRRRVHLFQRTAEALGKRLGRSTGWILKAKLRRAGVETTAGVRYDGIDDRGLHYTVDGRSRVAEVDHVVICAGQTEHRELHDALQARGVRSHLVGGADACAELDALRAIDQATRLAISI